MCTKMHLITVVIATFFFQGFTTLQLSSMVRIYPRKANITVDVFTDLTLGCRGAEPIRWTFDDTINGPNFNSSKKEIRHIYNDEELEYKHETILTIYNVSNINIGFYYCHGEKVDIDTPRRSSRIYVFVYDENNLSVITSEEKMFMNHVWLASVPCKPTSPDINISLTCNGGVGMSVYPGNYSGVHQGDVYVIRFHSYHGFTVQYLSYLRSRIISRCSCIFKRNNRVFTIRLLSDWKYGPYLLDGMSIEVPDTLEVGDNMTLQCVYLDYKYFPYYRYWPQWDIPISRTKRTEKIQVIKLKTAILIINIIIMKNISAEDEGIYKCQMDSRLNIYISDSKYVFVNDKKSNYSTPRIYSPNRNEIEINSGTNITLRCAGSSPITWASRSLNLLNKSFNIEHLLNLKNDLYEVYLHITVGHYTDTGLYYCHENDSMINHPFKSDKIYIFVKDEQNLYVPLEQEYEFAETYSNVTVPCLPTSRDVKVSLSMLYRVRDPLTESYSSAQMFTPTIYAYDPRKGFTIQLPGPGEVTAMCIFVAESARGTLSREYYINDYYVQPQLFITGPQEDLVFVGQTLELSCIVRVQYNVFISNETLRWTSPNNFTSNKVNIQIKIINLDIGKVLISKLILQDINESNEGRYFCHLMYNNATADKFITVYDNFDVKPFIEIFPYDSAYIGQPLFLRCNVDVEHNVGFQMFWTTPNITKVQQTVQLQYIQYLRNTSGEITLKIHNTTYDIEGNYSCNVFDFTNRRKITTQNIPVKKGKEPRIITSNFNNQEEIVVLFEETVNLTCSAEGDPRPVITWMKDSTEIQILGQHINFAVDNSELTIHNVQRIDVGLYTCIAQNPFGRDSLVVNLRLKTVSTNPYIATVIFMIILIIIVSVLLVRTYGKQKLRKELNEASFIHSKSGEIQFINPFSNIAEQAALLSYDPKWEIPRNKIQLGRNLGSGYFGLVVEATISDIFGEEPEKTVAVKMLHGSSNYIELDSLICELKIMTELGKHINLINLIGACTDKITEGNLLVIIEYCKHGSLRHFLLENRCNFVNLIDSDTELICLSDDYNNSLQDAAWRGSGNITTLQLLRWALEVARGMEFLAAKQVLHGDLAVRNILLDENYVVKISDFGLSKILSFSGYYKKKSQCPLPIKWMAIESIRDKTFSIQSDVWAFGVVLWELFSLARTPYAELEPDFRFYRKLESGYRLERPEYSTREIYQVMRECWCAQPQHRPTFSCLVRTLTDLFQEPNKRSSVVNKITSDVCTSSDSHSVAASFHAARQDNYTATSDWITLDIVPRNSSR